MCITVGCQHLDDAVADFDNGNIEGTAAEVIYHNLLLFFVVKTVSQRCCGRLVDDTFYFQTCNLTCILGCLTLCIVEVCGNGNNGLRYLFTQVAFRICFQFLKNHCGNLLRRIFLTVNGTSVVRTHISLDGRDGLFCIGDCLTLCRFTDQSFAGLGKCYNRGCCSCAFCVCDDGGFTPFHNCYAAVCCS